jgi:predicted RNA-binding Zn-ribbon protein involved in translation (DUF1610 family)
MIINSDMTIVKDYIDDVWSYANFESEGFNILKTKKFCPNCGKEIIEDLEVKHDELGNYAICPHCGSTADIGIFYEN